jgi:hypothetical protein
MCDYSFPGVGWEVVRAVRGGADGSGMQRVGMGEGRWCLEQERGDLFKEQDSISFLRWNSYNYSP